MDEETQKERDERLQKLWSTLDSAGDGQIDINGLKKGLKKMDHRMGTPSRQATAEADIRTALKNADTLLHDVLKAVDTSGDGQIQYNEFKVFVQHAEKELRQLFESIDRDHNGELDKDELKSAFRRAGLAISNAKLDQFFDEVDVNHDGVISFDEWRDFLLFIPAGTPNLRAVLSYYSSTATVNPEGDVHINDSLQGLGKYHHFRRTHLYDTFIHTYISSSNTLLAMAFVTLLASSSSWQEGPDLNEEEGEVGDLQDIYRFGYFIAGGVAGMVSRTVTAPLDRLKVYLIAQTSPKKAAVEAAKEGAPIQAVKRIGQPLIDATKELWKAGGVRSLFAGNGLNVVKVMPESAIKFGAYEASKRALARFEGHNDPKHLHPSSQFLAGGVGGVVSQCVVYPLDTLKFRMQCETVSGGLHGNALIRSTASKMLASPSGIMSYYRGLGMGLLGMFPYSAIDLFIFENLKSLLLARKARLHRCHEEDVPIGNFATGAIGALSGAVSATMVYPLNVLRTRLQAQGTVLHPPTYTGVWDVTRKTVRGEGVVGLFRGVTPNLLKVAPAVSISYVVYENCKGLMGLQ